MNKNELKKVLKPLIKECIKEVVFEEGTLSTIISEVVRGTSAQNLVAETKRQPDVLQIEKQVSEIKNKKLLEQRRKMLDAIGRDAYNGVDLFEGTVPASTSRGGTSMPQGSKPLDGIAPSDPGVDISAFGTSTNIWKKLAGN